MSFREEVVEREVDSAEEVREEGVEFRWVVELSENLALPESEAERVVPLSMTSA